MIESGIVAVISVVIAVVFSLLHWITARVILPGWVAVKAVNPSTPLPSSSFQQEIVDGLTIWVSDKHSKEDKSNPVVVCNFGNAMSLDQNAAAEEQLLRREREQQTIVMWDYRGVGRSESTWFDSPLSLEADAKTVIDWVMKRYPGRPIICWGHSIGTWASSIMATVAGIACKRLVISAGFSSLTDVNPLCWLLGFGQIAPASILALLHPETQMFIVHASDDTLFPEHHPKALASRNAQITRTRGGHNSPQTIEEAVKKIAKPF